MNKRIHLLCLSTVFAASVLSAQNFVDTATNSGTIRTTGPTGNPWFHNAQGPGDFASYAISTFSFTAGDFGLGEVTGISAASISYTQANAAFTTNGAVSFHVTFDSGVSAGDYSSLTHTDAGAGVNDAQFSDSPTVQVVGTGMFTEVASGNIDSYNLDFSGVLETLLVNAINGGSSFSIILAASDAGTAATYAGMQSNNYDDPITLSITAIPEPSTYAAIAGLAALGLIVVRRRRQAR